MKSLLLPPLSALYGAVTRTRLSLYRRGTFQTVKLDRPVISVGNITVGGTGKTPLVEWVARTLARSNKNVCILTRGYGRDNPQRQFTVSDGKTIFGTPAETGDEPYLLATNLLGVAAVISGADRIKAGRHAIEVLGIDCFVLDDGFQHLRLARDLDIVTIDATNPWGGGHLLPYGRLRESAAGLSRADCVVMTRCDQVQEVDSLRTQIASGIGGRPVFESRMRVGRVRSLVDPEDDSPPRGRVAAFCGIGNPSPFFNQLPHEPALKKAFTDHHSYTQNDIDNLVKAATRAGAKSLITTAKDAVKLRSLTFSLPCYVLEIEIQIENENALSELIRNAAKVFDA